jgi:hypothetical protein
MRGHEQLAKRRRDGYVPALVWVLTDGYCDGMARLAALGCPMADHLELKHSDNPKRLDLRCLIGLAVEVTGSDERRVAAVARACLEHGAKQVIAAHVTTTWRGEEPEVTVHRITFTNEELDQWPA